MRIRIIFGPKFLDKYEYKWYSDPNFWTNTNTNDIRTQIFGRIRIRIIFGFQFVVEYEYEYLYSNIIRIPNYSLTSAVSSIWPSWQIDFYHSLAFSKPASGNMKCKYATCNKSLVCLRVSYKNQKILDFLDFLIL